MIQHYMVHFSINNTVQSGTLQCALMNQYSWYTVGYIIPTCLSTEKIYKRFVPISFVQHTVYKTLKIINCCTIVTAIYITFVHLYIARPQFFVQAALWITVDKQH